MKFSIRDLLFVTVIAALMLGWWIDRSRLAEEVKLFRDPDLLKFKATALELILRERGVTVDCPSSGELVLTENGQTSVRHFEW